MKERLIQSIGEKASKIQISTYHSFCSKVLRKEISKIGYSSSFNILDNKDQQQILSPIYKKYNISPKTLSYNSTIAYISKNKILFNDPKKLIKDAINDDQKILAKIFNDYTNNLNQIGSLDFDDLLIKTKEIFDKYPEVSKK
jgi:DNA helicase-2/ATP-dependent DNA helicase PcrA